VVGEALAGGLLKNGLTLKPANHAGGRPAKSAGATQPADLQSEFHPKLQKQPLSYLQKKRPNSRKKKQVQKELAINISAKSLGKRHGPQAS
jgi:hypothetical protein